MEHTAIKRGKYELGHYWEDKSGREWKIIKIADSELGNVFKLRSDGVYITLSEYTLENFIKRRVRINIPHKIKVR